jgi:hypothetical protein
MPIADGQHHQLNSCATCQAQANHGGQSATSTASTRTVGTPHEGTVGRVNTTSEAAPVAAISAVVREGVPSAGPGISLTVHHGSEHCDPGSARLCQEHLGDFRPPGDGTSRHQEPDRSTARSGSVHPNTSSGANSKGSSSQVGANSGTECQNRDDSSLENSLEVGRNLSSTQGAPHPPRSGRDYYRLVYCSEGSANGPVQAVQVHGSDGRTDVAAVHLDQDVANHPRRGLGSLHSHDVGAGSPVVSSPRNDAVLSAQHQEGRDHTLDSASSRGPEHRPHQDLAVSEARTRVRVGVKHHSVRGGSRGVSQTIGNAVSHKTVVADRTALEELLAQFDLLESGEDRSKSTITRRSRRTHLPATEDEWALPIHLKPTSVIDERALLRRAQPWVKARIAYLRDKVLFPRHVSQSDFPTMTRTTISCMRASHCAVGERCNIMHRVDPQDVAARPTIAMNKAFPIVELKADPSDNRLRMILWTAPSNARAAEMGYQPDVPLGHASLYNHVVHDEAASLRDLHCGFWGIEIPLHARAQFRFEDDSGSVWELCRLPMGHTAAPEYMHTFMSLLVGHPDYCLPQFAVHPTVTCHVWIDNVRWTGPTKYVSRAASSADDLADRVHAMWKAQDTRNLVTTYDWIGQAFDHTSHTVRLAAKNLAKLPASMPTTFSFEHLEALTGRLIHAAGVLHLPLASYYLAIKWVRRRCNDFNRGLLRLDDPVTIPPSIQRLLQRWVKDAQDVYAVPKTSIRRRGVLCVDASTKGYGATFFSPDSQIFVVADIWRSVFDHTAINVLEGTAVALALEQLEEVIKRSACDCLLIMVDNTSILHGIRRGTARSILVVEALRPALERLREWRIKVDVAYVQSQFNPADRPSRGMELSREHAEWGENVRRGAGDESVLRVRFSPVEHSRETLRPKALRKPVESG